MQKFLKYLGLVIAILVFICAFFYFKYQPADKPAWWGLTFSHHAAQGLDLDWKTMYLDMLSDLKPRNLRLMTYWEDIEQTPGTYDFTIAEQQVQEAQKQGVNVVLVVGRKQPRWPECHEPNWFKDLSADDQDQTVLNFVTATVNHFKSYTIIKAWQVENEPYFSFGDECPLIAKQLFEQEVAAVKNLDVRPVVATDSGERGSWIPTARSGADILGTTVYRVSYDEKYGGYYKYPIPPAFFRIKAGFLQTLIKIKEVWDVELQMEPWFPNGALNTPLDVQKSLMNAKIFRDNIEYALKTGLPEHYLWGVEWWYWMAKTNNDWGMWTAAKNLFAETK